MLEPVSLASVGLSAVYAMAGAGSAISQEAIALQRATIPIARALESSRALFAHKADAISTLARLKNECVGEDWDGYGALPMDTKAFDQAVAFIRAMPDRMPIPEFAPEPDGSVSLDWIQSRNRVFSLSIGAENRLAYAWLDGTDQGHAVARFDGRNVPTRILEGINSIFQRGNATVGPA